MDDIWSINSNECQLDIINELYLRCIQDKRDKEKLFLDIEADNGNIDMVKKDINDKMKQNIKNMKKDPKTKAMVEDIIKNIRDR